MEWWSALSGAEQFFYGLGIVAFVLTVIQSLLALLGMGLEGIFGFFDFDFGADGSALGLFSSHTISAFFLGFGWGGGLALSEGLGLLAATAVATGAGLAMMFAMYLLLRALLGLQSDGTLKYENGVGQQASVYVTIPGGNQDGGGQIQVLIQGRLTTASARRKADGALRPGERVKIVGMAGPTSFLVEPLSETD